MQSLTQTVNQEVITTLLLRLTANLNRITNRSGSSENSTSTKQVSSVIVLTSSRTVLTYRHTIINNNGITVPVSQIDSTLDTHRISVLTELQ